MARRGVTLIEIVVVLAILAWTQLTAPIPHSEFQVRHVVLVILLALAWWRASRTRTAT